MLTERPDGVFKSSKEEPISGDLLNQAAIKPPACFSRARWPPFGWGGDVRAIFALAQFIVFNYSFMLAAAMFHALLARLQEKFRIHARANWTHAAPLRSFVPCSGVEAQDPHCSKATI